MKKYIVVYYDNMFHKFANTEYEGISKSEVIHKFISETPKDFVIINIIEL